jgi:hypothetical protein
VNVVDHVLDSDDEIVLVIVVDVVRDCDSVLLRDVETSLVKEVVPDMLVDPLIVASLVTDVECVPEADTVRETVLERETVSDLDLA